MSYKEHIERVVAGEQGVNPYLDLFAVRLEKAQDGEAAMSMEVSSKYFQGAGVMQGGLIAALADEAMAYALLAEIEDDKIIATVDISHTHLAPVFGGRLTARSAIIKKGKRMAFLEARSYVHDNLVLNSRASFMILPRKK
jgi:uncharacterized protein (TIGR00369 family)